MADELDRLWAAVERMRAEARGGPEQFRHARERYDELLAAIHSTARHPIADVARASGLSKGQIRRLRREAKRAK